MPRPPPPPTVPTRTDSPGQTYLPGQAHPPPVATAAPVAIRPPPSTVRSDVELTERQQHILSFVQQFSSDHSYPPSMREIGEHFGIRSTNGVSDHLRALERKGFLQRDGQLSRSLTVVKQPLTEVGPAGVRITEPELLPQRPAVGGLLSVSVAPLPVSVASLPANVVPLRPPSRPGRSFGERLIRRDEQPSSSLRSEQSSLVPVLGRVAAGQPLLAVEDAEETLVVDQFLLGGPGEVFALRVVGESMIDAGILPGDYLFVRKRETARSGEIVVAMLDGEATVKRYFAEGDRVRLQPENTTMSPIYVRRGDRTVFELVGVVVGVYRRM